MKADTLFNPHLREALFVHMVHHDDLIVIAGGGASRTERQKN